MMIHDDDAICHCYDSLLLLFNHLVLFSVYYMMISLSPVGCADTVDDDDDAEHTVTAATTNYIIQYHMAVIILIRLLYSAD